MRVFRSAFLLLAVVPLSQSLRADAARDNRWKQDIAALSNQLPSRAANLFFVLPRAQFDQEISDLSAAVPSLSDAEIATGMARIVAMAGDAHTQVALPLSSTLFRPLPLSLAWFQDGLYVVAAAPAYQQALRARVVQIGEKTVDEAYQLVSTVISHENDYWVRVKSPSYLTNADVLQALKITSTALPVRYGFEDSRGNRFSLDIEFSSFASQTPAIDLNGFLPPYLHSTSLAYWFTYLADSRTLYFKYNQCTDVPGSPFAAFASQLFATFDANPVDRLVLDMRNNGGGDTSVINPFVAGLQQRQQRFTNGAKLYVLFNRGTFSSAMLNVYDFRGIRDQLTAAGDPAAAYLKLLGEPTGGNPTVPWRNTASFALPNSGLTVVYTTVAVQTNYQSGGAVMPDLLMPLRSWEFFSLHDPVLAAVLADSDPDPTPATSAVAVLNAAGQRQGTAVSPGSLASAFGDFSAAASADASGLPLPTTLGGVQLLVNGTSAQLLATRPAQINFLVPSPATPGRSTVSVVRSGATLASGTFDIAPAAPGIFSIDPADPARPGAILNQDNAINAQDKPAHSGEVVQIYATGVNAPAAVFFGFTAAEVLYSGPSGQFPGLWQVNARIPPDASTPHGQVPVFLISGTAASNAVTLWIQ